MPRRVNKRALSAAVISGALIVGAAVSGCHGESSASLVAEARQYQQKGDNKAALIQLKNAVSQSPEDAEVRLLLATLYIDTGDSVSAEKELRKALSLGASAERVRPPLAKVLLAQGQFQKVLDETQAAGAHPGPELAAARGDAYLGLNQPDKAREAFDAALAAQPGMPAALLGLARYAMTKKDTEGTHRYVDQAVAANPKNPDALMFKGALLSAEGKIDEAQAAYDKVLVLKPDHRSAHVEKAYLDIRTRKFDAARADLAAARKVAPNNLIVTYTQALLDYTEGKDAAALESLQKVLRAAPEHMPSILLSGAVEARMGSNLQAEQHLQKYLQVNPDNAYARKLLASVFLKGGRGADAVAVLAPAAKEGAQDPQVLAMSGEAAMQAGDFKKASAYFEQASALAPNAAALHTSLGLSKLGLGDSVEAERQLELATTLDAKSAKAGFTLVVAELRMKHYDKALTAVLALEKAQPADPLVQNLKGGVYLGKSDLVHARACFEKALAIKPDYFPAIANLAQLDVQAKNPAAARKRYEAVLATDKKNTSALNALADLALADAKPEQATAWLEQASNENGDALAPALRLGAHYLRNGQQQKALTLARKFQTANSSNPDLLDLLGQAQLANDDKPGALDTYGKLVAALPKSAAAQFRLAGVNMMMKNDAAAVAGLNKAVALQPDFLPAQLAQLELAERKGNVDQALAIARQIQKQRAKAPVGYVVEGDLLFRQKKDEQALAAYEQGFALARNPQLMIKIHTLLARSGKDKLADARLAQWQKDNPADVQVPMYVAETSIAKKQYKVAAQQLQAILKETPKNAAALNNLAWAYQQDKDPRALATAEQAYQLAPDSPAVMDTLGWLLVEQGNSARGLPLLQKAGALAPAAPEIHLHVAAALNKAGDKARARKELEQMLSNGNTFPQAEEARALLKQL